MLNGSGSLYVGRRYELEIFFDVVYVLAEESRPLSASYLTSKKRVGAELAKLNEILEKCEKKGLVRHDDGSEIIKKYKLTQHGKELIYTWLDYVYHFNLKSLLKSRKLKRLPEKRNSRLEEIMKKSWKKPNYTKSGKNLKRIPIMLYRDFLSYLKTCYERKQRYLASHPKHTYERYKKWEYKINRQSRFLDYSYKLDIIRKIGINSNIFNYLKKFGFKRNHIDIIDIINIGNISKWENNVIKKKEFKICQPIRKNIKELINIIPNGIECLDTFDKIMMEFGLTDLVYTSKS